MVTLSPDALIAIIVIAVVVVVIIVIILICCLCRQCEQCAKWSRRKAYAREEAEHERQKTEKRHQFDQAETERQAIRDQIRAKYNLNDGRSNAAVIP
ncbi:unnamed protein product [Rotaria sp. Silwood2]|nr:unnamed protein product [Rotaria sp. Silwood2]CAF2542502.1 unnamed protein product [Rotaria sp. Silwood2]CAF2779010.1 unnamed protein product [Rotaria sp. Silwood2]CAF3948264.1 unnamed protein product [Rotaria sp. Silwood2]CAF4037794.1 unnamed protein product [Rotaria sp. Silwood2]